VDNTPGDKLGVWRDMRLADALVVKLMLVSCNELSQTAMYLVPLLSNYNIKQRRQYTQVYRSI